MVMIPFRQNLKRPVTMHEQDHNLGLFGGEIHYTGIFPFVVEIFKHALVITVFVIIMMLLIEYLTVQSRGRWYGKFEKHPGLQIVIAALLGLTPGCLGVYMVVSLYVHRIFHFAALTAAMVATSGDEAFVMFAMIPGQAVKVMLILFVLALISGFFLYLFPLGKRRMKLAVNHMQLYEHDDDCQVLIPSRVMEQIRHISFERAVLISAGLLFLVLLLSGDIGPDTWNWKRIIFLLVTSLELFIALTVPDHFLGKHLWGHVIRKHFGRVFAWTFGAFLVIHVGLEFLHLEDLVRENLFSILVLAVLVGIIPESGPHILFITLYATGNIPMSILLASSITQDGHGSLPLLAETRKDFLRMKGVNLALGLLVGIAGLLFGF
jgi:hypothetical protein